ncbi:MAG: class I SAM-dependent RNA methyltransferase [Bdellovibrionales bacterium]
MNELKLEKTKTYEFQIEKLSFGGMGIAHHQGMVFFIDQTAPGDLVLAKVTKLKKRYGIADLMEILKPGLERRTPPCKIANLCGGCNWQHLSYKEQISQKELILSEILNKSKINFPENTKVISSPEFYYRNRIQVRNYNQKFGFLKKGTHQIADTKECLIAEEGLFENVLSQKDLPENRLNKLEVYKLDGDFKVSVNKGHAEESGFSQVNDVQNTKMISWVQENIEGLQYERFIDLYCGNGNFVRQLRLPEIKDKIGVEQNPSAIQKAKSLDLKNEIHWRQGDVIDHIRDLGDFSEDLVLIDPPRIGAAKDFLSLLIEQKISKLVYISCDPNTFVRDLEFIESLGVEISVLSLSGLDMFPQTHHIEVVSVLEIKRRTI